MMKKVETMNDGGSLYSRLDGHLTHVAQAFTALGLPELAVQCGQVETSEDACGLLHTTNAFFSTTHDSYMAIHGKWMKACMEWTQLASGRSTPAARLAEAAQVRDGLRLLLDDAMVELLRARAVEQYGRIIPTLAKAALDGNVNGFSQAMEWASGVEYWAWSYFLRP